MLAVATGGQSSKVNGASLLFKIAYPLTRSGASRGSTRRSSISPSSCPRGCQRCSRRASRTSFETDRGGCPAASIIGHALVHTPILPVPLEGPVYFVSYGGAKFPDAVMVLQGYGVTIDAARRNVHR